MMKLSNMFGTNREAGNSKDLEEFINVLLSVKSKKGMEDFLKGILTAKELLEIPNRLKNCQNA